MKSKKLKKKILPIIGIICLILVIITLFNKKSKIQLTPELSRTQVYDEVKEEDKIIVDESGNPITAVEFDAFFLKDRDGDGNAESIRGTCNEVGTQASLYMELKVLEQGHITNGTITINSDNFYFNTSIVKDNEVQTNYISSNTKEIKLNDIGNGTQKLLIGSVRSGDYSSSTSKTSAIGNNTSKYSLENSVTFSGTFVDNDGIEIPFTKTVPFMVDWYGEVNCEISPKAQTVTVEEMNGLVADEGLKLDFNITATETKNQLIMQSSNISGTIPELNGYKPISVKISGANVTYTYDEETGAFTAGREAVVNENGIITSNAYTSSSSGTKYNSFNFTVVYPIEAYQEMGEDITSFELAIPVEAVNKGYNNPHEEDGFTNPFESNKASGIVVTTWRKRVEQTYSPSFNIYVGTYMGSPYNTYVVSKKKPINIYNGISLEETNDTYLVQWRAYTGTNGITNGIIMNETTGKTDNFKNTSGTDISMDELTTNKGIYFSGATETLGSDGWINVYDTDTGSLLHTFTAKDWSSFTSSNPFKYENPVKHIKIETSSTNATSYLYVNNIKILDDEYITENFTREEFDNLAYIYSYLDGYMINKPEVETDEVSYWYKTSGYARALYEAPTSIATIEIKDNTISTHKVAENEKITIQTVTSGYNEQGWKDGSFLVQLPSEIILAEINNVITNNQNVKISAYDIYEENGNYYIKILTESENEETYNIVVDCDLTPDPRISKTTGQVKLWAKNETACDYYYSGSDTYDIDGDENVAELVNYRTVTLTMDPGSSLSTTQTGSNYGEEGGVTIAPRVAKTDKDQRTANITITATNNYTYDIQDIKILGVVPFEGNKYVISGNDLGSTFTTYMSEGGISTLTDSIKNGVTIYYSTNETPNENLEDMNNGWTLAENIEDWSKVKTYLIVLDNSYKLGTGEKIEFEYEIQLPKGVDYNEVSYSEHAIYFALATEEGLYHTSTGSAKLGFMIAKQYDLEIVKYQKDTAKTLEGITFTITEDGADTSTIKVTNKNGVILVSGLYVERYYTIKEIKTTDDYVLNDEEIRFYTYTEINEDGSESLYLAYPEKARANLQLNDVYSSVQSGAVMAPDADKEQDYKIQIKIEDDVKAKLAINKVDKSTGLPLRNIKFTLSGEGKNGEILTTDVNGNVNVSGLYLDKEYVLQEIKATDYYIPQTPIKFTISNNNGNFELKYTDNGTTVTKQIVTNNEIPTIELDLENEKIPSYGLQLTKYAKGEKDDNGNDKVLGKAQYLITGEGIKPEGKIYTTDDNGVLTIDGLYEYVNGKYITGVYTLTEIYAPEGYSLNSTSLKFKAYRENGTLKIQIIEGDDVIRTVTDEVTGDKLMDLGIRDDSGAYPVIEIGVEDGQIFSLFKYREDGTTGTKVPIAGTKFMITDLDGNYVTGSDGKLVGEWFVTDRIVIPYVNFSSTSWKQKDDGTWEVKGPADNSQNQLISNDFEVKKGATLKFDWSVSSEGPNWDYVYYTIKNVKTNATIGGTSTKIGGSSYGSVYESLTWLPVEVELGPGTYNIEFIYRKDSGGVGGLDSAFVKNMRLEGEKVEDTVEEKGCYVVTTDKNGLLTANLPEGLYKAIEVYTDSKYILEENEADRTYYFGIGASQAATWDWVSGITGKGWNYINSVSGTKDGGVISVGSFSEYSANITTEATDGIDVNNDGIIDKVSQGNNDGLIILYDTDGICKWSKAFGGDDDDCLNKIIQTSDGGYVAVGYVSSKTVLYDGNIIDELSISDAETNLACKDGVLIKLDSDGNYEWGIRIGGSLDDEIQAVIETSEKKIAISGSYFSKDFGFYETGSTEVKANLPNTGERDAFVATYSETGKYEWSQAIGSTSNVDAPDLTQYSDGIAVAVNTGTAASVRMYGLTGTSIRTVSIGGTSKITGVDTLKGGNVVAGVNYSSAQFDARIYKITATGTSTVMYTLKGTYDEYVSDVKATSDGGILFGGWYYSTDTNGDDGLTFEPKSGTYASDGYVIKIDSDAKVVYSSRLYGDNYDIVNSVTETRNGSLVSGGSFNSSTFSATNCEIERPEDYTGDPELMLTQTGNSEGFVIAGGAAGASVPEAQRLEVENRVKEFKITTEVIKNNGVFGGEIDGETDVTYDGVEYTKDGIRYIETVDYGKDSTKSIKITPDANFIISYIKINDVEYTNFTIAEDGTVTIPIFENVTEDKHIVVQFSNTMSNLEVNHYLWTTENGVTTEKLLDSEYYTGEVAKEYVTQPATDIDYEIITNGDYYGESLPEDLVAEDLYIPDNYKGTYIEGVKQVVNYYYKEKTYTLIVHHYLEGTNEPVPLKGSLTDEKVQDELTEGLAKGSKYTTAQGSIDLIDYDIYELVEIPQNAEGVIEENTEVTYYYRIKTAGLKFTKVAEEDHSVTLPGTEFTLYEYIGQDTSNEIIDTKNVGSDWKVANNYKSSNIGIIRLEDLPITSEYRLVETKSAEGRMIPDGQWKIEFIYGSYDENDTTIVNSNGTLFRVTAIGNPPALAIVDDGELLIPNKEFYNFPTSGDFGITGFYKFGIMVIAVGLGVLVIAKKRMKFTKK